MPTLDKASLKWMIQLLDEAYQLSVRRDRDHLALETTTCWNIRQVREMLINAAIVDLNVEAVSAGELTDLRETKPE